MTISTLISLIKPKNIIALAVILMAGYATYLFRRVDSLKAEKASLELVNQNNAKELETVKANYTKTVKALENYIEEKRKLDIQIKVIRNGKSTDTDRPASPMLSDMFVGVRNYYKDKQR
jgi:FlaG/FlaF family flagellin (archaellin)